MENDNKRELLGLRVDNMTCRELLNQVEERIGKRSASYIVFVNSDVAVKAEKDKELHRIIHEADFAMVDGKPLVWIAKAHGKPLKEKVSGSDFVPALCREAAERGWSVFLLGGERGVPEEAAGRLKSCFPPLHIVGMYSPPRGFERDKEEVRRIKEIVLKAAPDILVVCFGCPKQEKFIYEHYREYGAYISICAGATVDFLAGRVKRCPRWMSDVGLEWFYRFMKEPRRLFKRYFIDDMKIFLMAYKYRPGRKGS